MTRMFTTRWSFLKSIFLFAFKSPKSAIVAIGVSLVIYFNRWSTIQENIRHSKIMKALESQEITDKQAVSYSLFLLLNLVIKSLACIFKPSFYFITEYDLDICKFQEELRMPFDFISLKGVSKLLTRHSRYNRVFMSSVDSLVFSIPVETAFIVLNVYDYQKILTPKHFMIYSLAGCVFAFLFFALRYRILTTEIALESVESDRNSELAEIFDNIIAIRLSAKECDPSKRTLFRHSSSRLFAMHDYLKVCSNILRYICFPILNLYILNDDPNIHKSFPRFVILGISFSFTLKNIADAVIDLERNWRKIQEYSADASALTQEKDPIEDYVANCTAQPRLAGVILENVTIRRNGTPILNDISLRFAGNGLVALIGRNGSGKSTFARFLLGLHAFEGVVWSRWEDAQPNLSERPDQYNVPNHITPIISGKHVLRKVTAYSPQKPGFFEQSIPEVLGEGTVHTRDEILQQLKYYGIHDLISEYDTPISMDMSIQTKHLISLGRSLMSKYPIMVLDETLDDLGKEEFSNVLSILNREKNSRLIFLITHRWMDMSMFDSIIRFDDGYVFKQ